MGLQLQNGTRGQKLSSFLPGPWGNQGRVGEGWAWGAGMLVQAVDIVSMRSESPGLVGCCRRAHSWLM